MTKNISIAVVGDGTPGSVTEAALRTALQNSNQIVFNTGGVPVTINLNSELVIKKNVTIDGEGLVTLDGGGKTRIINLDIGKELHLKNLTLTNGFHPVGGGAIQASGLSKLTIESSNINNSTSPSGGGLILGWRSQTNIISSTFDGNQANSFTTERGGGAIATTSTEAYLTVKDSLFINNKGTNGGAINTLLGPLYIEGSTFINNDATSGGILPDPHIGGYGGAIYTDGASAHIWDDVGGDIIIKNSYFEGNKGTGQGGALFLYTYNPDRVLVENSTIINNSLIQDYRGDSFGAGLRVGNGSVTVKNTTFSGNLGLSGNDIWAGEKTSLSVEESTFYSPNSLTLLNSGGFQIRGTQTAENLAGTSNSDTLDGSGGNDTLFGKKGNDTMTGGAGNDVFIFWRGHGDDIITDFGGVGRGGNPSATTRAAADTLKFDGAGLTAKNMLLTQNGADLTVSFEGVQNTSVTLQNFSLEQLDNLLKATGSATDLANIWFNGQNSNFDAFDVVNSELPFNQAVYNKNTVTFLNDLDNNTRGYNDSNDIINGQGGNDTLSGLSGDDILRGGAGDDFFNGGQGNDTIAGGTGSDRFFLATNNGSEIVTDFENGIDLIVMQTGLKFSQLSISQGSNATFISLASTGARLMTLNGISADAIGSEDFLAVS